ncbi:MAG: arylsulfotransferase family protein [Chitinophagales bacterium]
MRKLLLLIIPAVLLLKTVAAQFVFISPVPGSNYHPRNKTIILSAASPVTANTVNGKKWYKVTGSGSGEHHMKIKLAADGKTILLNPDYAFEAGEMVSVVIDNSLRTESGMPIEGISFSFRIQPQYSNEEMKLLAAAKAKLIAEDFGDVRNIPPVVRNSDDFPKFEIDVNNNPAPGDIFYYTFNFIGAPNKFMCIMSSNGDSVYSEKTAARGSTFDINKNGYITVFNYDSSYFEVWDSGFNIINTYTTQGYSTDPHDFLLLPNGHSILLAYDPQIIDMTVYNSSYKPDATVTGAIIQEFDADRNLIFEWRSWDHVDILEAQHIYFSVSIIDYIHLNSIEVDTDSNLLVSCRMLEQVLKINRTTGEVMWRMGGEKNEFTFPNDPQKFSYQHDCRRLPNGHITIFDNGCYHIPAVASFKEYEVDEENKIANLVFSYQHPPIGAANLESWAMGNAQRLSNGNTFINWGYIPPDSGFPNITEIDSNKNIVWEMRFTDSIFTVTYRAHRYQWDPCVLTEVDSVATIQVSEVTAIISWAPLRDAGSYLIQYQVTGAMEWDSVQIPAGNTFFVLDNLMPATKYSWLIQALCSNSKMASLATGVQSFTTLPAMVDSAAFEMGILVFPNPATGHVYCVVKQNGLTEVQVMLTDLLGKERFRSESKIVESGQPFVIPVDDLSRGLYFLKVTTGKQEKLIKLLLE